MDKVIWALFWIMLILFWIGPKQYSFTIDGVNHTLSWETQPNDQKNDNMDKGLKK